MKKKDVKKDITPICRNIQNSDFYAYLGENKFKNLRTEKEGEVDDEKAREVFRVNIEATMMFNEYPLCKELLQKINLKFDNNKN